MLDLNKLKDETSGNSFIKKYGEIQTIEGHLLISKGPICKIGDLVHVGKKKIPCEVIALKENDDKGTTDVYLMPLYSSKEVMIKDKVYVSVNEIKIPSVNFLLGRVLNGLGEVIDERESLVTKVKKPINIEKKPIPSMKRERITEKLLTGIKAIDGFLTIGEGQKIGIFAGTGVGKSTLLGQIAKNTHSDVNVICLVGERGREVKDFIEKNLGEEGMSRSILVVATSDEPELMKIKASKLATSIAEELRDQGKKVLLMMDSITRFGKAVKSVDLATGQVEVNRRTPSLEPEMQQLLERSGKVKNGSITGIYTVLVDGDDLKDAIPDIARGTLDGHITLERKLFDKNHFPAINILSSISRVMDEDLVGKDHWYYARNVKKLYSIYKEHEDEIRANMISPGENSEIDEAKIKYPLINKYLQQEMTENVNFDDVLNGLKEIS